MSAEAIPSATVIKARNIGTVLLVVAPLILLARLIPLPATENFDTFTFLFSFLFVCLGCYGLYGISKRGRVILSLGYHPLSYVMLGCSALLLTVGMFELLTEAHTPAKVESAVRAISMGFGFGALHITGRCVCERGIWFMGDFLRWEWIKSFTWDPDTGEFRYEIQRKWFPWKYGIIMVPERYDVEFIALVEQHVGDAGSFDSTAEIMN